MPPKLQVIPLGGLGEFGMNCTALRFGTDIILVDAGMMLPDRGLGNNFGVDLIVPDISFLLENSNELRGIILTHGHEDHTGGLAYIVDQIPVPIFGNRLTLALVANRLREKSLTEQVDYRVFDCNHPVELGSFRVEALQVTHSFPESYCLGIQTPVGRIVWTGDFKFDQTPVDGRTTDLGRLAKFGEEGVLALFSDSTNSDIPGLSPSESSVYNPLRELFHQASRKIFVGSFASSMHRVQILLNLAQEVGRQVVPMGRSMISNIQLALDLGYLRTPSETLSSIENLPTISPEKLIVVATGSQGEPMSALNRLAGNEVSQLHVEKGDLVILSSRIIPGNEKNINKMADNFSRIGAQVVNSRYKQIHASGHGFCEDLKLMINLTRPRFFVPIHGEHRQLAAHAQLARDQGIPKDNVLIIETGDVLCLSHEQIEVQDKIKSGRRYIDEGPRNEVDLNVLRDRRHLSSNGLIIVVLRMDSVTGELIKEPELISRGFVSTENNEGLIQETRSSIRRFMGEIKLEEKLDESLFEKNLQTHLKRFLRKRTRKRPLIISVTLPT